MRTLEEIQKDIDEVKKEIKDYEKQYGKAISVEYAELVEELDSLIDEYEFSELHLE
jgi:hypothetical protein